MSRNDFTNEQIDTFANAMTQFIERVAECRNKLEATVALQSEYIFVRM